MEPFKNTYLKSTNLLVPLLIAFLGFFTSCNKEEYPNDSPFASANYIVKGTIESTLDNQPIPDIKLEMYFIKTGGKVIPNPYLASYTQSDIYGGFSMGENNYPGEHNYRVTFTDMDGELNGEFQSLDTIVVFKNPTYIGGDGSDYWGMAEKELNVKLKPKI